jgi:hypothetical protein
MPMRSTLVLTFLAGLVVGLLMATAVGWQRQVQAQGWLETARRAEKPSNWEYKVVSLPFEDNEAATDKLNQLADDRWEYAFSHRAILAFRRPKQ